MPRYATVLWRPMAEQLEEANESLALVNRELRAAVRKEKPKQVSKTVLRDAISLATCRPDGLLMAERWMHYNKVVNAQVIGAALEKVRLQLTASCEKSAASEEHAPAAAHLNQALSRRAQQFLTEYKLHTWLADQNLKKGLAPARAQVWQRMLSFASYPEKSSRTLKGQRQWCRRWRSRWSISSGRIACREMIPEKDMQDKVAARSPAEGERRACVSVQRHTAANQKP
jgi:hypothetical protein